MVITYTYSESAVKPVEIEVGKHTVFLRKNIAEEVRTDSDGNDITFYTYEEARLTRDEFDRYSAMTNSENIATLVRSQEQRDNDLLVIMEAMADLYEAMAGMVKEG